VDKKCFTICDGINKKNGIKPPWDSPPCPLTIIQGEEPIWCRHKKILSDYQETGSIKMVGDSKTLHLIPWFLISKTDLGGK
jgi:hypothetical protein